MIENMIVAVLVLSGLVTVAIFSTLLSFRIGAPLLLVFLGVGLAAGEAGIGGISFDDVRLAYLIGSLGLAAILFDSGFHTPFKSLRMAALPAVSLASVGVLITSAVVMVPAMYLLHMSWPEGLLLGAIVSSTDAAAVFFLLRVGGITIRDRVRSTLEVESGSNDPMAIFLTSILVTFLADPASHSAFGLRMAAEFAGEFGIGLVTGVAGGWVIVQAVNKAGLERGLVPIAALTLAMVLFAGTTLLGGSGFLAVYIAGLVAGNARLAAPESMRRFQDGITWLAQIAMFLTLGLLASPKEFWAVLPAAAAIAAVLMLVARPLAVWLGLAPFRFNRNETGFVAWVGLRGAVSVLLSILPMIAGLDHGRDYFNVAFLAVLISLAIQGWTIKPVAKFLGMIVPSRIGPVERMELEIPGAKHELVAYRIVPNSLVAQGHMMPRWAVPSLVLRDGRSLLVHAAGQLRPGDMVYLFARPDRLAQLDRLFASPAVLAEGDRLFFGDFGLEPQGRLKELGLLYGLPIPEDADGEATLAEFIRRNLGMPPGVGDRVTLGPVELIVRSMTLDGKIAEVGLALEPTPIDKPRLPVFQSGKELRALVRKVLG